MFDLADSLLPARSLSHLPAVPLSGYAPSLPTVLSCASSHERPLLLRPSTLSLAAGLFRRLAVSAPTVAHPSHPKFDGQAEKPQRPASRSAASGPLARRSHRRRSRQNGTGSIKSSAVHDRLSPRLARFRPIFSRTSTPHLEVGSRRGQTLAAACLVHPTSSVQRPYSSTWRIPSCAACTTDINHRPSSTSQRTLGRPLLTA